MNEIKEINKIIKSLNEIPEPFSVDGIIKIFENNSKKIIKNFAIYFYKENGETILWNISNNKFDLKNGFKFQLIARNHNFGFIVIESEIQKEYLYILVNHLSLILYSEKLSFLANRDRLTGIYNRGYVFRYLLNKEKSKEICPNDDERMNIILDITYGYKGNRQFCWDCIGELIIKRLEEMEEENKVVYTE